MYGTLQKECNNLKNFAPLFDKKLRRTFMVCLWICAGSAGIRVAALYKTVYCSVAIKVRRVWL